MLPLCLLFGACGSTSSETGLPPEPEFASIDDVGVDFGAYELAVTSIGAEPFTALFRPPPVGLTLRYDVAIWHSDASGREQGVTGQAEITVLVSAADGSAAQLKAEFGDLEGWVDSETRDDRLTEELSALSGSTTTYWLDSHRVVSQSAIDANLESVGVQAETLAQELFEVPNLLALPTPSQRLGQGATWSGATRAATGVETVFTGRVNSYSSGRYRFMVDLSLRDSATAPSGSLGTGQLIVVGTAEGPFPDEKHLVIQSPDGSGAGATIDLVLSAEGR